VYPYDLLKPPPRPLGFSRESDYDAKARSIAGAKTEHAADRGVVHCAPIGVEPVLPFRGEGVSFHI